MSTILGTQEFLAEHKDHNVVLSIVALIDQRGPAYIDQYPDGQYYVAHEEIEEKEHVQNTGAYVYCYDCKVEEREVNLGEVDEF